LHPEVLASTCDSGDRAARNAVDEVGRTGGMPTQRTGIEDRCPGDAPPDDMLGEAPTYDLDFGQFRHRKIQT